MDAQTHKLNRIITHILHKYPQLQPELEELKNYISQAHHEGSGWKQIDHQLGQLKGILKSLVKKYESDKKIYQGYKMVQKLSGWISNENKSAKDGKLPSFFEHMHMTSTEMRISMLQQIKMETNKRNKLQEDYQHLYITMRQALLRKQKKISELQEQIILLEEKVNNDICQGQSPSRETQGFRENLRTLEEQLREKSQKEKDYLKEIQILFKKLQKEKKQNQILKDKIKEQEQRKTQQSISKTSLHQQTLEPEKIKNIINQTQRKQLSRPPQPDPMDNLLEGFSELPNQRNLTSLENTFSQHYSERKAKSTIDGKDRINLKGEGELWRMLVMQAMALEQQILVPNSYEI